MHEPTHPCEFQEADTLAVSGYVAQAAKRALTSRAPPDAYLVTDLYQILITPDRANPISLKHPGR